MLAGFLNQRSQLGWVAIALSWIAMCGGCGGNKKESQKYPRPVKALVLQQTNPSPNLKLTGVVSSWKTEEMGFEVPGRVLWVLEPGRNIQRRIEVQPNLQEGETEVTEYLKPIVLAEGEPLAKLDPAKFNAALKSSKASLVVAEREEQVAKIQSETSIEAEIASAEADLKLAQSEFARMETLLRQRAISEAELENAQNRVATQQSRMDNLKASRSQAEEQLASAEAGVARAQQALNDAQRDLDNTELFGSYQGQVSEVHVVPGSIVNAGTPVLTLQMMNPIKVEIEVSAEQSREIQKLRQLPITFQVAHEEKPREALAFVYLVDPAADMVTRTFTVTLLVLNEQFVQELPAEELPEGASESTVARAEDVWPADLSTIVVGEGEKPRYTFEAGSIYEDASGKYVWVVNNGAKGKEIPALLQVSKAYIETLGPALPFLGNWEFTPGRFLDPALAARSEELLVAGALTLPDPEKGSWDGKTVFVDRGKQWLLRPGDLVTANVSERKAVDWYVPAEVIYVDAEQRSYLYLVDGEQAKRVEIEIVKSEFGKLENGELVRFKPATGSEEYFASSSVTIVGSGVQFLIEGEQINVTETLEFSPTEYIQNKSQMPPDVSQASQVDNAATQVGDEVKA